MLDPIDLIEIRILMKGSVRHLLGHTA